MIIELLILFIESFFIYVLEVRYIYFFDFRYRLIKKWFNWFGKFSGFWEIDF